METNDNTGVAVDGARRRRPLLLSLTALGAATGLLGGLGVFADVFDRSTTGTNSYETGDYVELDLQIAEFIPDVGCGEYSDDLATGLFAITDDEIDGEGGSARVCLRNVGARSGQLMAGVIDVVDTETGCTGSEADSDTTCGTGEGELSSVLELAYDYGCRPEGSDVATVPFQIGSANLGTLGPGAEITDLCIDVLHHAGEFERRVVQTDRVEWRFAFDLSAPEPCATEDDLEPNDSHAEATPLGDAPVDGVICRENLDVFAVEHPGGDLTVQLDFVHDEGDLDLQVSGPVSRSSTGVVDGEIVRLIGAPAGTYYATVIGFEVSAFNSYVIRASIVPVCSDDSNEPNDARLQATVITTNAPVSGARCDDDDWYVFTAGVDGASQFMTVTLDFDHADGDLDLYLRDADGNVITSSRSQADQEVVTHMGAGTFYVQVAGYLGANNPDYTLQVARA